MTVLNAKVGEFTLVAPIGRGGFSDVWEASHPQSRRRFVVKTLRLDVMRDGSGRAAFEHEADAVARLAHPNIVTLHDFGEITVETDQATDGRLRAGSPYLVTEFYPLGSIHESSRLLWPDLRNLLGDTLRALAHAHARRVLHLDVKPANVLMTHGLDGRTRHVVTDFGTAAFIDRLRLPTEARDHVQGTPMYMAPERLLGADADQGAWTDIYAVAVMFWVLAAGRAPFPMRDVREIANAHIKAGIPRLPVDVVVPDAMHAWFARASHRDPGQRFRTAAEALESLASVDESGGDTFETTTTDFDIEPLAPEYTGEVSFATTVFVPTRVAPPPTAPSPAGDVTPAVRPRIQPPLLAEQRTPPRPFDSELSLGSGLLGRRDPPLVGRHIECRALWEAFSESVEKGEPRIVVIEGAAGTGKSRLARWVSEAAEEYCGAIQISARHAEVRSQTDGIAPAIARAMRASVSTPEELRQWSARRLQSLGSANPYAADALADLLGRAIFGPAEQLPWNVRLTRQADRHDVAERVIRLLAAHQPVVLWIDDAQWAPSALMLAERIMKSAATRPVALTIAMTARSESRLTSADTFARIDELSSGAQAVRVALPPQPIDELVAVLSSTIALEHRSAREIARRSAGNPLVALQWLESLFRRGSMRKRKGGWGLVDDVELESTPTAVDVWNDRVDQALGLLPDSRRSPARFAIERVAAHGGTFSRDQWLAMCSDLGTSVVDDALAVVRESHLCLPVSTGWTFAHGLLAQAMVENAARHDRLADHYRRVIAWLRAEFSDDDPSVAESIAEYLQRGSQHDEAFDVIADLLDGDDLSEVVPTRLRFNQLERAFARLTTEQQVGRADTLGLHRLHVEFLENTEDTSIHERIDAFRDENATRAPFAVLWDLDAFQADIIDGYANAADCARRYSELLDRAVAQGDIARENRARTMLAVQYEILGRPADAIEVARPVRHARPTRFKRGNSLFNALNSTVRSAFDLGRFEEGVAVLFECDRLARGGLNREALSSAHMLRCEALIRYGEFGLASAALDEALDIAYTTATNRDILCHVHRTALCVRSGDWERAISALHASMPGDRLARLRGLVASAIGYSSAAMAELGLVELWDRFVPDAIADFDRWGVHEPVLDRAIADAGLAWLRRGDTARARLALERAARGLSPEREEQARQRIESMLADLDNAVVAGPPFLAAVRCNIESCPAWLRQPLHLPLTAVDGESDAMSDPR